jgi:hypothetical protein
VAHGRSSVKVARSLDGESRVQLIGPKSYAGHIYWLFPEGSVSQQALG